MKKKELRKCEEKNCCLQKKGKVKIGESEMRKEGG